MSDLRLGFVGLQPGSTREEDVKRLVNYLKQSRRQQVGFLESSQRSFTEFGETDVEVVLLERKNQKNEALARYREGFLRKKRFRIFLNLRKEVLIEEHASLPPGSCCIDFLEESSFLEVGEKIVKAAQNFSNLVDKLRIVDSPKCIVYYQRHDEESICNRILVQLEKLAGNPSEGSRRLLVVTGPTGIGKTMFLANLLKDQSNKIFLMNACSVVSVKWVNCYRWRNEYDFDEQSKKQLNQQLLNLKSGLKMQMESTRLVIFDDVFHFELMEAIHEICNKQTKPATFGVVVIESERVKALQASSIKWSQLVEAVEEVGPMNNEDLSLMLATKYGVKMPQRQLINLADSFQGSPTVAVKMAAEIKAKNVSAKHEAPEPTKSRLKSTIIRSFAKRMDDSAYIVMDQPSPIPICGPGLKYANVPDFGKSYPRLDEENMIRDGLKAIGQNPNGGVFILSGQPGVGKVTLLTRVLRDVNSSAFLNRHGNFQNVIWLNCCRWSQGVKDQRSQLDLKDHLVQLGEMITPGRAEGLREWDHFLEHFSQSSIRTLFVLYDVLHGSVVDFLRSKCRHIYLCIVVRDLAVLNKVNFEPGIVAKSKHVINPFVIGPLSSSQTVDILLTDLALKDRLREQRIAQLATSTMGHPLTISLVGGLFANSIKKNGYGQSKAIENLNIRLSKCLVDHLLELNPEIRMRLYAFLLFEANEPVAIQDITFLWHCDEASDEAEHNCRQLEKLSLLRRNYDYLCWQTNEYYMMHSAIFEACADAARQDIVPIATALQKASLSQIRVEILKRLPASADGNIKQLFEQALSANQRILLERLLGNINPTDFDVPEAEVDETQEHQDLATNNTSTAAADSEGVNAFMVAAHCGHLRLVKHFFTWEAVTARQSYGHTALIYAAKGGHLDVVRFLLEKCPKLVQQLDDANQSALMFAVQRPGNAEVVTLLSEKWPLALEMQDNYGQSVLHLTADSGSVDVLRFLALKSRNSYKFQDSCGQTILMTAAGRGSVEMMTLITEKWPQLLPLCDNNGATVLMFAAASISVEPVTFILERWPESLTIVDKDSETVLMYAVRGRGFKVFHYLAELCQELDDFVMTKDAKGKTVLMHAGEAGNADAVKYLCNRWPRLISATDESWKTAMDVAIHFRFDYAV